LTTDIIIASGTSGVITVGIKNINIKGNITLEGNASAKLLLDGTNKISGSVVVPRVSTVTSATLTIDSTTFGSLNVTATGSSYAAGIGGKMNESAGTININGGTVTATGRGGGAGIGGGSGVSGVNGGSGGMITINGGTVTATSFDGAAGIGGGHGGGAGGTITINSGTVTAISENYFGAGIGGGDRGGSGGTITINGGTVTATGGEYAPGIGGGAGGNGNVKGGSGGTIIINGGTVTATGGEYAPGIGGGAGGTGTGAGGTGASLTIKSGADVKAYSMELAIHAASVNAASGYFVNAVLNSPLPSGSTTLKVYADGDTISLLSTLAPPRADYKGFAFMIPEASSSANKFNIYAEYPGGSQNVLLASNSSPIITAAKVIGATPVKLGAAAFIAVTDISNVPDKVIAGTPLTLSGTVSPTNATSRTITWSVKDADTTGAVIEGNVLTTSDAGTVKVTATIANGKAIGTPFTKDFTISVSARVYAVIPVVVISNVPDNAIAGTPLTLSGTVSPAKATNKTIIWSVKDAGTTGAVIEGNVLTTSDEGTVKVTATIADGKATGTPYTQDFTIIVSPEESGIVAVTNISNVPDEAVAGTPLTLSGTVSPSDATNKAILWSVKDEGTTGAEIEGGVLTASSSGIVTVTATIANGTAAGTPYTKDFTIEVSQEESGIVAVTNISNVPDEAVTGTPLTLSGTVSPTNATNKTITWSVKSAGTTGASIAGGVLTVSDSGTVVVTATIADGTAAGTPYTKDFMIDVSAEGAGETESSGGSSNTLLWVGIAAVIIVLLIVTVFILQKKGIIKGI